MNPSEGKLSASELQVPDANTKTAGSESVVAVVAVEKGDKDNGSDLRGVEVKKHPAEWNFAMKIPDTTYRPPVEIPAEQPGKGANRFTYFVCTSLTSSGGPIWSQLPAVTPHQINVSRRIRKFLSGNLDARIDTTYPKFPGTERHFLRALIARISAGTQISPRNFYKIESCKSVESVIVVDQAEAEQDDDVDEDDADGAVLGKHSSR